MENLPLAQKVLTQITWHPETFNMGTWGTPVPERRSYRACLAGHTLLQSGYDLVAPLTYRRPDGMYLHGGYISEATGLLGLHPDEARVPLLFGHDPFQISYVSHSHLFEAGNARALAWFRQIVKAEEDRRCEQGLPPVPPVWHRLFRLFQGAPRG